MSYESALQRAISRGWIVVSEGPSGAQLTEPKKMKALDRWLIGIGLPLILLFGIGFVLVIVGLVDFALFTRERTFFLNRCDPKLPTER